MKQDRELNQGWIDVTRPITPGMAGWPGDPAVEIERFVDMGKGEICNVSRVIMCAHSGTHIDAPAHFIADGAGAETAPLDALIGPARVIEIHDPIAVRRAELEKHNIQPGERLLFKTRNSAIPPDSEFQEDFVYVAADAARFLAEKKVRAVGIDYMSVGGFNHDLVETHVALLEAGIWIIENLDLTKITPGNWEMICLPLKLTGSDGAPARALLRGI